MRMRRANQNFRRQLAALFAFGIASLIFLVGTECNAQSQPDNFPRYLAKDFDYANFTRFDADGPPKDMIYQSNGFMALQEKRFGGQTVIVPVSGEGAPTNGSDRPLAVDIGAAVFADSSGKTFNLANSPAERHVTYYADRTTYHALFDGGPQVLLTVYPVYGKSASVLKIAVVSANGPIQVRVQTRGMGFQLISGESAPRLNNTSPQWPYRLQLGARPEAKVENGVLTWEIKAGREAAVIIALGENQQKASRRLMK
jgi:hypothetical protein